MKIQKKNMYVSMAFSILIEKLDSKPPIRLLMDTGQSGAFFDNAEKMGVSLDKLDAAIA